MQLDDAESLTVQVLPLNFVCYAALHPAICGSLDTLLYRSAAICRVFTGCVHACGSCMLVRCCMLVC